MTTNYTVFGGFGAITSRVRMLDGSSSSNAAFTAATFDAATIAWVAAVVANGGTVSLGRETLVDALIVGLKTDGIWTKLDRLNLYAAENEPSALTDLVATALSTAINSPTFTVDSGYPGAATKAIDTGFTPSTAGGHYTLNSAMIAAWAKSLAGSCIMGAYDGSNFSELFDDGTQWFSAINTDNIDAQAVGIRPTGLISVSRTASNAVELYANGVSIRTGSLPSTALPSRPIYTLGRNNQGTIDVPWSTAEVSMAAIGGSFTGTDAANFYSRLRTYMTAVGVP